MTKTNNQPTAHEIAGELSAEEWVALKNVADGKYPNGMTYGTWCNLDTKGLLISDEERENVSLSIFGKLVLEATRETPAGEGRPTSIKACEWDTVAEDVKAGRCVVRYEGNPVISVKRYERSTGDLPAIWYDIEYADIVADGAGEVIGKSYGVGYWQVLQVEWLTPPQPAPSQPVSATAEGSGADAPKFRKLEAGVSPTDYRETLTREGLLDYIKQREATFEEIYNQFDADKEALRDQNAKLREALKFYADTSNYIETWNAKQDNSWIDVVLDEGKIARKALDDLRKAAKEGEGS